MRLELARIGEHLARITTALYMLDATEPLNRIAAALEILARESQQREDGERQRQGNTRFEYPPELQALDDSDANPWLDAAPERTMP